MRGFFRAFVITLTVTLIPFLAFVAAIRADEVTRKVGYDDNARAVEIEKTHMTVFGNKIEFISENDKIKQAGSFLTPPDTKLEYMLIQKITELIASLEHGEG